MTRLRPLLLSRVFVSLVLVTSLGTSEAAQLKPLIPGELLQPTIAEPGIPKQADAANVALHIVVVQGEDAVNIVKRKTAVQPVVEVRDKNNLPVGGASVTFTTPGHGASGVFLNGSRSATIVTDSSGRAAVTGMKPVNAGAFKINVTASVQGQIATATIAQTNVLAAAAAGAAGGAAAGAAGAGAGGGLSAGVIAGIVAGVAAAAAAGAAVAATRGGAKNANITAGTPTISAPH